MSVSSSNGLCVREMVKVSNRNQATKVLEKWSLMAAKGLKDENLSPLLQEKLADCQKISEQALSLIKSCNDCTQFHLYVCFDNKKIAQGMACTWVPKGGNKVYLSKIVSCPWNIFARSQFQREHSAKGAGTALLVEIRSESIKLKKDLHLNSVYSAKEFYLKFGFVSENENESNKDAIPMVLHYPHNADSKCLQFNIG